MSGYRWVRDADDSTVRYCDVVLDANGKVLSVGRSSGDLNEPAPAVDLERVQRACDAARERQAQKRRRAATKAAETRKRRTNQRLQRIVKQLRGGQGFGPASRCVFCRKPITDPESRQRGIGSECWQGVLRALEDDRP